MKKKGWRRGKKVKGLESRWEGKQKGKERKKRGEERDMGNRARGLEKGGVKGTREIRGARDGGSTMEGTGADGTRGVGVKEKARDWGHLISGGLHRVHLNMTTAPCPNMGDRKSVV